LIDNLFKIFTDRVSDAFDELLGLLLAVCSVALVYWVTKKVLLLAGMGEESVKYKVITHILLFIEGVLVLKFLWEKLRKE